MKLFHLIFADDVFVVSGATKKAMQLVKKTLHEFKNFFGVKAELTEVQCIPSKGTYFYANNMH